MAKVKEQIAKLTSRPKTATATGEHTAEVPDYSVVKGLSEQIVDVTREYLDLTTQRKAIELRLGELKDTGARLLIKARVKSVMVNGNRVTRTEGSSSRLDKKILVEKHGSKVLTWLEEATVRTPWTSLKVTPPSEESGDEE